MKRTANLYLDDVDIGGVRLSVSLHVTIADQGIGPYEFWGYRGCDSRMGIDELEILDARFLDEDHPEMTPQEYLNSTDAIQDDLYEKAADAWEDYDGSD